MDLHHILAPPGRGDGFTLVEIMVVVAIIGVLLGIAIPSMIKVRSETRLQIAHNDIRVLSTAIQLLAFDTGKWPGGVPAGMVGNPESWDLRKGSAGLLGNDGRFPNWKGPYIEAIPMDPWGENYFFDPDYSVRRAASLPVLGSFGPNRVGRNVYDSDDVCEIMSGSPPPLLEASKEG